MGRKIDMKKIENITKCQVTFSKRRSSLMRKAGEISICCDVDVAFVAFSPSGRVSKFSNQTSFGLTVTFSVKVNWNFGLIGEVLRAKVQLNLTNSITKGPKWIEDVLERYVNLSADNRLSHIDDIEGKMEKLNKLSHIHGDNSKLQFLEKQIENLELQIKKGTLELQMLERDLRDYELGPEQEPSLHQLSWCERNLNHSLYKVMARKDALEKEHNKMEAFQKEGQDPYNSSTFNQNGQVSSFQNPITAGSNMLMQLDPWISSYSAKVRESIFHDLVDQSGKQTPNVNQGAPNFSNIPSNMPNFSAIQEYPNLMGSDIMTSIPSEQSFMVDQSSLNFHDQYNDNAWNSTSSAVFSDSTHVSTQILSNFQYPRFPTRCITNPNLMNQLSNMEGQVNWDCYSSFINGNHTNMEYNGSFINDNPSNNNVRVGGDYSGNDNNEIPKIEPPSEAYIVPPPEEGYQDPCYSDTLPENANGENAVVPSTIQKAGLWEWDTLLLDENFNLIPA